MDETATPLPSAAGRRILIVEDNADLAFGLKLNLEVEGHEVLIERDGDAAVCVPNAFHPDLIILDIVLPRIDGFELLRRWRRSGVSARVIILSARGGCSDRVTGLRLGADDYVTKPFHLPELLERVARQLYRVESTCQERTRSIWVGNARVDMTAHTVTREARSTPLTPKEYQLFAALLEAGGTAVAKHALLETVWGHQAAVRTRAC